MLRHHLGKLLVLVRDLGLDLEGEFEVSRRRAGHADAARVALHRVDDFHIVQPLASIGGEIRADAVIPVAVTVADVFENLRELRMLGRLAATDRDLEHAHLAQVVHDLLDLAQRGVFALGR